METVMRTSAAIDNERFKSFENRIGHRLLAAVAEDYPLFWKKLYPRRYQAPASYDTPKAAAHAMVDAVFSFVHAAHEQRERGETPRTEQVEAQWAAHLTRVGVPTYYLTRDLAEALMKTRPASVNWLDMKLPRESAVFMLPKGVFPHAGEGCDVSFVSYCRNFAGDEVEVPLPWPDKQNWTMVHENAGITIIVRLCNGVTLHWTLNQNNSSIEFSEELGHLVDEAPTRPSTFFRELKMSDTDRDVQLRGVILLFNILLFMTAKPEMVEGGSLIKRVTKKRDVPAEYWLPNYIGRTYRMRRIGHSEPQGGTHASPRGHWVSGHWRVQPYGPKWELRRTLWIEPFFRGGDTE